MDKTQEALKLALEALEIGHEYAVETAEHFHIEMAGYKQHRHDAMDAEVKQIADAITAIREALAEQPAQQPVAWINTTGDFLFQHPEEHGRENEEWFPLVHQNTSPPASKPLTDAQIGAVAADIWGSILIAPQSYQAFARAIEAAHGITGETK